MKQPEKGFEDLVMAVVLAIMATCATAQPLSKPGYNYAPTLAELAQPEKQDGNVLGLFSTEHKASTALCIGGGLLMAVGSVFDGMAAKKATLYGTRDGNTGPYHSTRFVGRTLQASGAASYASGKFTYKSTCIPSPYAQGILAGKGRPAEF